MVEIHKDVKVIKEELPPRRHVREAAAVGRLQDETFQLRISSSVDFHHAGEHDAVWRHTFHRPDVQFIAKINIRQTVHREKPPLCSVVVVRLC